MKLVLLLVLLSSFRVNAALMVGPIPVSGMGDFSSDLQDGGWEIFANGSLGSDSVSFGAQSTCNEPGTPGPGQIPGAILGIGISRLCHTGGASIDGISSGQFDYSIGGGGGILDVYDNSTGTILLASATLIGYAQETSYTATPPPVVVSATFVITPTPTPEPSTSVLMCVGLGLIAILRRR